MTDRDRDDAPYYDDQRGTGRQQDEYGLGRDYGEIGPGGPTADTPDGELQGYVADRLQADPAIDKSLIDVRVREGRVILEGEVPDRRMRERAAEIAAAVPGVRGVDNRMSGGESLGERLRDSLGLNREEK